MKIFVVTGSPHRHGASDLLASRFIEGAREAGHTVERFDAAFADIQPCLGCDHCGMSGPCVHKDNMPEVLSKLLACDLVALATPLYYFGMSAQLKTVIDRFYSANSRIQAKELDAVLLATAWDREPRIMAGLQLHYKIICDYLGWSNRGILLGLGCGNVAMTKQTDFPQQAYRMGLSI